MGIANTTPAAALIAAFTGADPAAVTGRGTGIDDATLAHKTAVVRGRAAPGTLPDPADPLGVLAAVGGLEHAALAGFILGAAAHRVPVILDGVIAASAALAAAAFAPDAVAAMVAGHRSAEPGATVALAHLGLRPAARPRACAWARAAARCSPCRWSPRPSGCCTRSPRSTRPECRRSEPLSARPALDGRRVLVVGGGAVATRRVPALLAAGARVEIVAPELTPALRAHVDAGRVTWQARRFEPADVDGAWLVQVAVDDPAAAAQVSAAAEQRRVFCVRADDRDAATAWTPAVTRHGPVTVAVTDGGDRRRAMAVRDLVAHALESDPAAAPEHKGRGPGRGRSRATPS